MSGSVTPPSWPAGERAVAHPGNGLDCREPLASRAEILRERNFAGALPQLNLAACWVCLGIVLLCFLGAIHLLHPDSLFGYFHDDTLYFSSARALATGYGYIIPSLPGTPPQTKYPILYSWILSRVWKMSPGFPGNVMPAIWVTSLFGCWFLAAAFQFLRKMEGIGNWAALAMVAFIAFEPTFLTFNAALLSDVPFMALALTAMVLADSAFQPERRVWAAALAGIFAGLSADARTLGLATVIGIGMIAVYRREFRKGLVVCLAAAPFVAVALWPSLSSAHGFAQASLAGGADPAWNQTLLYYTSYSGDWRSSITSVGMLVRLLKSTGSLLLVCPAQYLLAPGFQPWSPGGMAVYFALTLLLFAGIARQVRGQGWIPAHAVLPVYCAILLIWPYPQMERFLLLFLPLFLAGLYLETKRLVLALVKNLQFQARLTEKLLAGAFGAILLAVLCVAAWNYARGGRSELNALIESRRAILAEKQQAYAWVREHTSPETRIVAFEDVLLYLNTGRQAVRPISFRPSCCFTNEISILRTDLNHIADVPRHIHASYWVMSDDYFSYEGSIPLIQEKLIQLQSELPVVFKSSEGHVQIYDLSRFDLSATKEGFLGEKRASD